MPRLLPHEIDNGRFDFIIVGGIDILIKLLDSVTNL